MEPPRELISATSGRARLAPRPDSRGRVRLYAGTWVAGERALHQLGPVEARVFVADAPRASRARRVEASEQRLLDLLRARAAELGANAVLTVEVRIDPFAERGGRAGTELCAGGSAVELEPARSGGPGAPEPELSGLLQ